MDAPRYRKGFSVGKWSYWDENGGKFKEGIYKDGKMVGIWITWYENGKKKGEGTYKDREEISRKCWDEDGNECECTDWYKFNL